MAFQILGTQHSCTKLQHPRFWFPSSSLPLHQRPLQWSSFAHAVRQDNRFASFDFSEMGADPTVALGVVTNCRYVWHRC
jgi:hypothetical protein